MHRVSLALLLLAACGDDDAGPSDAGTDAARAPDASAVASPAEPMPPVLTPCPTGWRELVRETGHTVCDPWPEAGPAACTGATGHFPGEPGCTPIGAPCPEGDFPDPSTLRAGAEVIYVRAGAVDGDGSRGAPFGTITEATRAAPSEAVVALAKGTYDGLVRIERGITVQGACPAETTITWSGTLGRAVVTISGSGGMLRDVRVANASIAGVAVEGTGAAGVIEGVVVENVRAWGAAAIDAMSLRAADLVVRDVGAEAGAGSLGIGVGAELRATLELRRVAIERTRDAAVWGRGAGVSIDLEDAALRAIESRVDDRLYGHGIRVGESATIAARRVAIRDVRDHGMLFHDRASAELDDVVIEDVTPHAAGLESGRGLGVQQGAVVAARRLRIERATDAGIFCGSAGAELDLSDVLVSDMVGGDALLLPGRGLAVDVGSTLRGARIVIERARSEAIRIEEGGALEITDAVVLDTQPAEDDTGGWGLAIAEGTARLARVRFERSRGFGAILDGAASTAIFEDFVIRDVLSEAIDGDWGRGLSIQDGATVELTRGEIRDTRDVAVAVLGAGARASLTHVIIEDVHPRACAISSCADSPAGLGIAAVDGAAVDATDFAVRAAPLCGVLVARDASIVLRDGEVARNQIGACIQVPGYDLALLNQNVRYHDNGTNLDSTELPVPESGPPG